MRASQIRCPAARLLHPAVGPLSVICGELALANDGAHVNGYSSRGHVSPVMSGDRDQSTIGAYCAGPGVPGAIDSYVACPVWRAARKADEARRKGPDALRDTEAARPPAGLREQLLEV